MFHVKHFAWGCGFNMGCLLAIFGSFWRTKGSLNGRNLTFRDQNVSRETF
jgi:hypothetical protein